MKTFIPSILMFSMLYTVSAQTNNMNKDIKQVSFTVHGNCELCKKRIEDAAISVFGVKTALWNNDYQMITVTYDTTRANLDKIHQAIAAVGHDTEKVMATDLTYKKLPDCCHYRKK
jgi:copper chaperone CopZ